MRRAPASVPGWVPFPSVRQTSAMASIEAASVAKEPVIRIDDKTIAAETIRGDTLQEVVRELPHTEGYIIIYSGWRDIGGLDSQKGYVKVTAIAEDGTKTIVDYTDIKGARIKIKTYPTEGHQTQYVLRWFPSR